MRGGLVQMVAAGKAKGGTQRAPLQGTLKETGS